MVGPAANELEPFLASLNNTAFDGDVCIFVGDVTPDVVELLLARGVIVERAAPMRTRGMNYLCSRFCSYLDFLTRHGERYAHVMLSDLRDVVFQSDPFAQKLPADIVFAQERCRIGDCPVNHNWLVHTYGGGVADNMRDCVISCSGTTFGTTAGMLRYLAAMVAELADATVPLAELMDQGPHNHIVHMRPLHNAWLDAADTLVATMHYMPEAAVSIAGDTALIDGRPVPVLHQWQKHTALARHIRTHRRFSFAAGEPKPRRHNTQNAVLCHCHGARDAGFLEPFAASLRATGFAGPVHCIGPVRRAGGRDPGPPPLHRACDPSR